MLNTGLKFYAVLGITTHISDLEVKVKDFEILS